MKFFSPLVGTHHSIFSHIGKQNVCKSGVKIFCHKEVKSNITPTLSKVKNSAR